MSEIVLGSLKKRFGAHEVVAGLDVTIPAGAAVALLGPSGCGKTTTLRMLAGLERPTSGSIALAGRVVDDAQTFVAPEHRDVGMVFQSYALWPHLTVLENVGYPLLRRGVPREQARQAARQMLTKVHLTAFADCAPGVLSGGQQQRVALARGLIHRPALLLLDEPLANLDTQLREEMRAEVATLAQQSGATVVSVTHDQAEAFVLAKTVLVMIEGRIAQMGAPEDVYARPATPLVATLVGAMDFIDGEMQSDGFAADGVAVPFSVIERMEELPAGSRARLGVRPEWLDIAPDRAAAHIKSTTLTSHFLGREREVHAVAGHARLRLRLATVMPPPDPGHALPLVVRRAVAFPR